jgi:hypothetical protein
MHSPYIFAANFLLKGVAKGSEQGRSRPGLEKTMFAEIQTPAGAAFATPGVGSKHKGANKVMALSDIAVLTVLGLAGGNLGGSRARRERAGCCDAGAGSAQLKSGLGEPPERGNGTDAQRATPEEITRRLECDPPPIWRIVLHSKGNIMLRRSLTIVAAVAALLVPIASYAQQGPEPVPQVAPAAAPAAAPPRGAPGLDLIIPIVLLVVVAGAFAHNN